MRVKELGEYSQSLKQPPELVGDRPSTAMRASTYR